jgi:effector-binding domain-containing protein
MKRNKKMIWTAIAGVAVVGAALAGNIASDVEQAKYTVLAKHKSGIEIREYSPHLVAQTKVEGERKEAINKGFRIIADYIFGNNTAASDIAMTAPVIQEPTNKKIAMTVPVTQESTGQNIWKVQFVMPAKYNLENLPKPNNNQVQIIEVPEKYFAVVRFSGLAGEESINKHTNELQEFTSKYNIKTLAEPKTAFYNPPITLPPLRRNEVMVEIAKPDLDNLEQ